jgi:hypothetical protein
MPFANKDVVEYVPRERRECGGEKGIRTLGGATPATAFEADDLNHSSISPEMGC